MKKLSVLFVIGLFFLVGCATDQGQPQIQIDPDSQAAIAKIAGRHAGNEIEKGYPDIANEVISICNDIIKEDNPDIIVTLVRSVISALANSQINDPVLKADIKDILEMIKVQSGVEVTEEYLAIIQATAEGLISGIEIAKLQEK